MQQRHALFHYSFAFQGRYILGLAEVLEARGDGCHNGGGWGQSHGVEEVGGGVDDLGPWGYGMYGLVGHGNEPSKTEAREAGHLVTTVAALLDRVHNQRQLES